MAVTLDQATRPVTGEEHWATKDTPDGAVRLFLWRKAPPEGSERRGAILFVHGSSMGSIPSFDLQVPGRPDMSVMDAFARLGYDTWTLDHEGYRRSRGTRDVAADIGMGADDLAAATDHMRRVAGIEQVSLYGVSSGALRAALFAQRYPERVKRLPEFLASPRRPIDRAFLMTIFTRDHPGSTDDEVIDAFIDTVLAEEDSVPNGTYVDMCQNLPVVDPQQIRVPTLILRGEYDGIAGFDDLIAFFTRLPNPDKHFAVLPGISHGSLTQKNYRIVHHIFAAFMSQPEPVYLGH
jgi:pimeloyl-ACP methyl ester carboxylesterase